MDFPPSHRWRVLAIGVAANVSFAIALAGIPTTSVFLRAGYALDTTQLGFVLAAMGLGAAISEVPWGLVTDRMGDRHVLLAGLGLTGALLAAMAWLVSPTADRMPSALLLGASLFLVGAIAGSLNGSSGRAIMAWFADGERGFAMSVRQTALPAGGALGALLLPAIAHHAGFRAVYAAMALFSFVTAAFAWAWLHEPPARAAATQPKGRVPAAGGALANPQIWRVVSGLGALCVAQIGVVAFAAVFLHDVERLGTAETSAIIVVFQVGAAVARVWCGRFTDRHKNRRAFLRACALATAAIFALLGGIVWLGSSGAAGASVLLAAAVTLTVAGGVVAQAWHGIAYTELATVAGARHVATALGLGNTFAFGMYFVTPLLLPFVLRAANWHGVWLAAAACAFAASRLFPKAAT